MITVQGIYSEPFLKEKEKEFSEFFQEEVIIHSYPDKVIVHGLKKTAQNAAIVKAVIYGKHKIKNYGR